MGVKLPIDLPSLIQIAKFEKEMVDWVEKRVDYDVTRKYFTADGLVIGVSTFTQSATRYSLTRLDISNPRWNHLSSFKIGESIAQARARLGVEARSDKSFVAAYVGGRDEVEFSSSRGEITRVVYKCAEDQPEQWN